MDIEYNSSFRGVRVIRLVGMSRYRFGEKEKKRERLNPKSISNERQKFNSSYLVTKIILVSLSLR